MPKPWYVNFNTQCKVLHFQVNEMLISRNLAERKLREHRGNVVEALIELTNWPEYRCVYVLCSWWLFVQCGLMATTIAELACRLSVWCYLWSITFSVLRKLNCLWGIRICIFYRTRFFSLKCNIYYDFTFQPYKVIFKMQVTFICWNSIKGKQFYTSSPPLKMNWMLFLTCL